MKIPSTNSITFPMKGRWVNLSLNLKKIKIPITKTAIPPNDKVGFILIPDFW